MKQVLLAAIASLVLVHSGTAQKYYTKNGSISFFSSTSMEDIKADNNQVMSVLNAQTGDMQFSVIVKSFHFKKALMEEHFNENYMESDKFPKSEFKGKVDNINAVNFSKDGTYPVTVSGNMTIHGVTKKVQTKGTVKVAGKSITLNSQFNVKPADYGIKIPSVAAGKIASSIQVTVASTLKAI